MKVERRGPSANKNFAQINDAGKGELIEDLLSGLPLSPKSPVFLEFSLGLAEDRLDISLRHNLFEVFIGGALKPAAGVSPSPDDPGLKFGGGSPWFSGVLSFLLTGDNVLDTMAALSGGMTRDELREAMKKELNIDAETLAGAFRSVGAVLGGTTFLQEEAAPGGYVFLSGGGAADAAEKWRLLVPLLRMFAAYTLDNSLEEAPREGWDVFFKLKEEVQERAGGVPFCLGLKDGVLIYGCLDEINLDDDPQIEWRENGRREKSILRAQLDMSVLRAALLPLFESHDPKEFERAAEAFDLADILNARAFSGLFYALTAAQEIESVTLEASDRNSLDLTFFTEEPDYSEAWKMARMARYLEGGAR
jgi:hypothetical protein